MNGTLPLFEELVFEELERPAEAPRAEAATRCGQPPPRGAAAASAGDRHLRAAWRLSRAMRRFPDRSPEQTRAGIAICHHLRALLAQANQDPSR